MFNNFNEIFKNSLYVHFLYKFMIFCIKINFMFTFVLIYDSKRGMKDRK